MERGSVEGEVFHRGAVAELSPAPVRGEVGSHLTTLVRKELIRSTAPTFPEDEGYRFRHLLIRDAAYESLPKATRAELHEQFADWLASHELVERDEIVGYHLEQAHRYRSELGSVDPALDELARRAAEYLTEAGRGALDRGDYNAGRSLLRRAYAVAPMGDERRHAVAADLSFALFESGDVDEAAAVVSDARTSSYPVVAAVATVIEQTLDSHTGRRMATTKRLADREAARQVLESVGDDEGLGIYWWSAAQEAWIRCRTEEAAASAVEGLRCFERAGRFGRTDDLVWLIRSAYVFGPTPVPEAIERVREFEKAAGESSLLQAGAATTLARLLAMQGDIDRARELHHAARETYWAAGMPVSAASVALHTSWIEQRAGDVLAWESAARSALEVFDALEERAYNATLNADLAECLHAQGRIDEIPVLCERIRSLSPPADLVNFVYADALEGCVLAHEGRHEEARSSTDHALEVAETMDYFFIRAGVRLYLAEVHSLAGRSSEATTVATEALRLFSDKGDVTGAARARERLDRAGVRHS
jgi:tetratricopeptide (TPR) repeat protein